MRRIAGIILAVIGLVITIIGIGSATIWQHDSSVKASNSTSKSEFLWTSSGVLDLVSPKVEVSAKASSPDAKVTIAYGYSDDVAAWVDGLSAGEITGLKDWETLKVKDVVAQVDGNPPLAASDNWLKVKEGKGELSLSYDVKNAGQIGVIIGTSDGTTPTVTIDWQREVSTSGVIIMIVLGLLICAIGVLFLAANYQDLKNEAKKAKARVHGAARKASRAAAETAVISKFDGDITSSSREIQTAATGHAFGAGIMVASPRSKQLRSQQLPQEARLVIDPPTETPEPPAPEAPTSTEGFAELSSHRFRSRRNVPTDRDVPQAEPGASDVPTADRAVSQAAPVAEPAEESDSGLSSNWRRRWGMQSESSSSTDPIAGQDGEAGQENADA